MENRENEVPETPDKVAGETVRFESFRRLQLVDAKPSDLEVLVEKEKAIKAGEKGKERDWVMIAIAMVIIIFGMMIGLYMFGQVVKSGALSGLFGGGGGGGGGSTVPALIGLWKIRKGGDKDV